MIGLGLILRHRIPQLNPGFGLYSTGLRPCTPLIRKIYMSKIPDNEVELFLNDLTDEDWVFMLDKFGRMKAMIVPRLEVGTEINETVINVFDAIDPAVLDTVMDLTHAVDNEHELDKAFEEYKKKTKETLH